MAKQPPHDVGAERTVLAAALTDQSANPISSYIAAVLRPEDFYVPKHRRVFEAICELVEKGERVDPLTVANRIKGSDDAQKDIYDIADERFAFAYFKEHNNIVKEHSKRRSLMAAGSSIASLATQGAKGDIVSQAEEIMREAVQGQEAPPLCKKLFEAYSAYIDAEETEAYMIPTGLSSVDHMFNGGIRSGELAILAARPGIGKSAFALNYAVRASKDAGVAYFSLEMTDGELACRALADLSDIDLSLVRKAETAESPRMWHNALALAERDHLYINDAPTQTALQVRQQAKQVLRKHDKKLIVVDYLQLMQPSRQRMESRALEVSEMTRSLKITAKELGCPVLVLSQLNRDIETRRSKRPQLSDLRESGAIEQDADIVMFLDRSVTDKEAEQKDRPDRDQANLVIAKNRNGKTGEVKLFFKPSVMRFTCLAVLDA